MTGRTMNAAADTRAGGEAAAPASPGAREEFEVLYQGTCLSLSGRSELTFHIGREPGAAEEVLHLRIAGNTGGGVICKDWVHLSVVELRVGTSDRLTAKTFRDVWPGRTVNNAGFLLAVLMSLGLVRHVEGAENVYMSVPGATLRQAVEALLSEPPPKAAKRGRAANGGT